MGEDILPVEKPPHVPDAAVYPFDMYLDKGLLADPHARISQILREAPAVFWTPYNSGHWVAMSREAVFEAARDWERFSSEFVPREELEALLAMLPPDAPHIPRVRPISLDPPDHIKYRAALAKAFGPAAIKARTEEIRTLAGSLLDAIADKGAAEFVSAVAEPLPVLVFLKMMGLPQERLAEFRDLVHMILAPAPYDPMAGAMRLREVADALDPAILARKDDPRDDLISLLWATEIDGEPMSFEIMEDFAVLLFIAGLDTVINGIAFGVRYLATHPEIQEQLRADPAGIPGAVEELLRLYSFVAPTRRVSGDTEFFGWSLKKDERIAIYLPGADRDPRASFDPSFDAGREGAPHLAFGAGPHRCVGSHLARLELQVLYDELLKRLPTFRLDPAAPAAFHAGNIIAVDRLGLRWD
jgi:cytochrome P450